jgi:arginine repressor
VKTQKEHTIASGTNTLTKKQFADICELIQLKENIVIRLMPGGGKSSIFKLLDNLHAEDIVPEEIKKVQFISLDCMLDLEAAQYIIKDFINAKTGLKNIGTGLAALTKKRPVYFVLDNFTNTNEKLLNYFLALRNSYGRDIKFIIICNIANYEQMPAKFRSKYSSLLHNTIDKPYFSPEIAQAWLKKNAKDLGIEIKSAKDIDYVLSICGGVPFLIKNFLRCTNHHKNFQETFEGEAFKEMVEIFWHKLTNQEQLVLKTLAYQNKLLEIPKVTKHLKDFNLIKDNKVNGKWIELIKEISNPKFKVEQGKIFWDEVDFTDRFTDNEKQILMSLIELNGEILDRDAIAHIIWGKHASSEFSAWAIDQNISRLRRKLEGLGIRKNVIKTIKKKGLKLVLSN